MICGRNPFALEEELADIFISHSSHSSNGVAPVEELVQLIEGGIGSTTAALSVCANSAQRVENPWDRSSPILSPIYSLICGSCPQKDN